MFIVRIDVDNAAFDPEPEPETARILRKLADRLAGCQNEIAYTGDPGCGIQLHDINGNNVGVAYAANYH